MRRINFFLSLCCMLLLGTMNVNAQRYYPTTRATTLEEGTQYMIFNAGTTDYAGDWTGFIYSDGDNIAINRTIRPSEMSTTDNAYIWTVVKDGDNYKLYSDGKQYTASAAVGTETVVIEQYSTSDKKSGNDVYVLSNADETTLIDVSASADQNVWAIRNESSSAVWFVDGTQAGSRSGTSFPFAFYEVRTENVETLEASIVYKATVNGVERTIATVTENVEVGSTIEADAAAVPAFTNFTGTTSYEAVAGTNEYVFTVEQNTAAIPFVIAESFATATKWYQVRMHYNQGNGAFWQYNGETAVGTAAKNDYEDNQLWCFVGNVFDGFKAYNKLAGESMTLSKPSDGNTASVMTNGNTRNAFKIYKNKYDAADKVCFKLDDDSHYLNHQGSAIMGWNSVDEGSSCDFFNEEDEARAELTATIANATAEIAYVGTDPGYYNASSIGTVETEITAGSGLLNGGTATAEEMQSATEAITTALNAAFNPVVTGYYKLVCGFPEYANKQEGAVKAIYANLNNCNLAWATLNNEDLKYYWKITVDGSNITVQNMYSGTFVGDWVSDQFPLRGPAANVSFTSLGQGQFNIITNGKSMHTGSHSNGAGVSGNIVGWGGTANTASAWKLVKVESLPPLAAALAEAKTAAQAVIDGIENANISTGLFYYSQTKIDAIQALIDAATPATNAEIEEAIHALVRTSNLDLMNIPADGKYLLKCVNRNADGNYLSIHNNGYLYANATKATRSVWQFTAVEGGYTLQNVLTGKYPQGASESKQVALSDSPYTLHLYPTPGGNYGKTAIGDDGNMQKYHESGSNTIVGWESGAGASQWIFEPYTDDMAESLATAENGLCGTPAAVAAAPILGVSGPSSSSYTLNDILEGNGPEKEVYAAADGKYYRFHNTAHNLTLGIAASGKPYGLTPSSSDISQIWQLKTSGNGFKLLNANLAAAGSNACIEQTSAGGDARASFTDEATAPVWTLADINVAERKFKIADGSKFGRVHMEEDGGLNSWNADASVFAASIVETIDVPLAVAVEGEAYATAYLPFDVTVPAGDVKAYVGDAFTAGDTYISMTEATEVKAENGFILKGTAAGNVTLTIGATDAKESALSGTLTALPKSESYLVLGLADGKVGFYGMGDALTEIAANKAFLNNASGNAVRMLFGGGNLTGIEAIENGELTIDNGTVYDLSGRAVNAPIKGGVYIKNGKKFIVK